MEQNRPKTAQHWAEWAVDDSCMFPHTFAARTSGPCVSTHLRPGETTRTFSRPKCSGPMHYVNQGVTVQVLSLRYATVLDLHTCHDSSALGLVHSTVTAHVSGLWIAPVYLVQLADSIFCNSSPVFWSAAIRLLCLRQHHVSLYKAVFLRSRHSFCYRHLSTTSSTSPRRY